MNKAQRKTIASVRAELEAHHGTLEEIRDAAQDAYDNMPESLQQSERGQQAEEHLTELDNAVDNLQSVIDSLGAIE